MIPSNDIPRRWQTLPASWRAGVLLHSLTNSVPSMIYIKKEKYNHRHPPMPAPTAGRHFNLSYPDFRYRFVVRTGAIRHSTSTTPAYSRCCKIPPLPFWSPSAGYCRGPRPVAFFALIPLISIRSFRH
jgi:hypothetical protein